ncbi:MAG: amino acid permease [Candidatus Lokiarchaeota archaeon]|nr:amino acid permease [Candidatus Lokiarchaeota archaeon]MBD3340599.1 amino acid permease [Candidatus Lokiarchaeota archaeon]
MVKKLGEKKEREKIAETEKSQGVPQGILYGIGCGIGGSIYVLLGTGIKIAGPGVLISLLLGGILIFLTALNYSELSTSLPISGGAYNFSKEGLGGFTAFIIGFFLWIANIATCSFSAQAFALVIDIFFPFLTDFLLVPIAIIAVLFISIVFFRTQRFASRTLIILTIILISIFGIYIISGLFISPITNPSGFNPAYLYSGTNAFGVVQMFALLFIFFTSITSNLAYFNADLKNPSKNIPRVNILAILFTLIIYLSITFITIINIGKGAEGLSESPVLLGEVLYDILGPFGFYLMGIAAVISTLIAMNAAIGSATSVLQALARDNYVPKILYVEKEGSNLPVYSLFLTTLIAVFFTFFAVVFADIGFTAEITSFIYFFGLAFVNFAAVSLRYKRKELDRPFKAPFFPYLPIIVGTSCLILAFALAPFAIILGLIIFVVAILHYLLTIADRYSIIITIAGIKFFGILVIGILIWSLNNIAVTTISITGFESFFTLFLTRFLIFICIFALGTVLLDIIPLREFVFFFVKRVDKEKVAINVGVGQIIELDKFKARIIYWVNFFVALCQIVFSLFVCYFAFLIGFDIVIISQIKFGTINIGQATAHYIYITSLLVFAIILLISGTIMMFYNQKFKTTGF